MMNAREASTQLPRESLASLYNALTKYGNIPTSLYPFPSLSLLPSKGQNLLATTGSVEKLNSPRKLNSTSLFSIYPSNSFYNSLLDLQWLRLKLNQGPRLIPY